MSKRLIMILALAIGLGLSLAAYAEVQNIKVGGDLTLSGVIRDGFDLTAGDKFDASGFVSIARVRIDADLTDNVAVTMRMLNERQWGVLAANYELEGRNSDIDVDLAYVALKEFLYSPLTLTLGRQLLRFGNAMVIGSPYGQINVQSEDIDGWGDEIIPLDLSSRRSFDAIRATLNYDPLVVDLVYAKIAEGDYWDLWNDTYNNQEDNDTDLYGINAKTSLEALGIKGTAEGYWFLRSSRYNMADSGLNVDECNTIGMLVSADILEGLKGNIEYARQFGTVAQDPFGGDDNQKRRAWALQAGMDYSLPFEKSKKYEPSVGFKYSFFSGDKDENNDKNTAWDPMFEDQALNSIPNALFAQTGMQVINIMGKIKPSEDITLSLTYGNYMLAKKQAPGVLGSHNYAPDSMGSDLLDLSTYGWTTSGDKKDLGNAIDLMAIYDYTEDVQFSLLFGYFNAGKALIADERGDASQIIGSMKVTF